MLTVKRSIWYSCHLVCERSLIPQRLTLSSSTPVLCDKNEKIAYFDLSIIYIGTIRKNYLKEIIFEKCHYLVSRAVWFASLELHVNTYLICRGFLPISSEKMLEISHFLILKMHYRIMMMSFLFVHHILILFFVLRRWVFWQKYCPSFFKKISEMMRNSMNILRSSNYKKIQQVLMWSSKQGATIFVHFVLCPVLEGVRLADRTKILYKKYEKWYLRVQRKSHSYDKMLIVMVNRHEQNFGTRMSSSGIEIPKIVHHFESFWRQLISFHDLIVLDLRVQIHMTWRRIFWMHILIFHACVIICILHCRADQIMYSSVWIANIRMRTSKCR